MLSILTDHYNIMASKRKVRDTFFHAVSRGSVDEVDKIINKHGLKEGIKLGKSFNREGETCLIVAIKENHLDIVKLLVNKLKVSIGQLGRFVWRNVEYPEAPPLFVAMVCHKNTSQPILGFLLKVNTPIKIPEVLDPIMASRTIPLPQKIDFLELIGSVYILNDCMESSFGVLFLRHAKDFRHSYSRMECVVPTEISYNPSDCAQNMFGNISEAMTLEQFHQIFDQKNCSVNETQAIMAIQRIMSRVDPDPHHPFFLHQLIIYGEKGFFNEGQYSRVFDILVFIVETFEVRQWKDVITLEWPHNLIENALQLSSMCLSKIVQLPRNHFKRQELTFARLMEIVKCVSNFAANIPSRIEEDPDEEGNIDGVIILTANAIILLFDMLPELREEEIQELKEWIVKYTVLFDQYDSEHGFLNILCGFLPRHIPKAAIQILIQAGANLNAADWTGDTPLHTLLSLNSKDDPNIQPIAKILVDAGAHLDQPNKEGVTPLDLFKELQISVNIATRIFNCAQTIRDDRS